MPVSNDTPDPDDGMPDDDLPTLTPEENAAVHEDVLNLMRVITGKDLPEPYAELLSLDFWDTLPTQDDLYKRGLSPRMSFMDMDMSEGWLERMRRSTMAGVSMFALREQFAMQFSFAVPSREILAEIAGLSRSIVEVGAGTGFWARLMGKAGIDVVATSPSQYKCQVGTVLEPLDMEASEAVLAYPDRDVLMSWPRTNARWLTDALSKMKPGRLFFYIGEWGGACGHDSTLRALDNPDLFEPVPVKTALVQFQALHDDLYVYRRTSNPWRDNWKPKKETTLTSRQRRREKRRKSSGNDAARSTASSASGEGSTSGT